MLCAPPWKGMSCCSLQFRAGMLARSNPLVGPHRVISSARDAFTEMILKHIQKCDHIERSLDLKLVLCIDNMQKLLEFHQ